MKQWSLLMILVFSTVVSFCQGLETVPPVLADTTHLKIDDKVSFLLTADLRHYPEGVHPYLNCVEIVDADQPWPPRWYFPGKKYNPPASQNDSATILEELFFDTRYQNGDITFSSGWMADYKPLLRFAQTTQYIICNQQMKVVDTLKNTGTPINAQDFRINEKGEKLLMVRKDTILDLRNVTGNEEDSAILSTIDIIEILDSGNKLIFQWNPVKRLGLNAVYFPYGYLKTFFSVYAHFDWSHGNSVSWDFDGNILYSFRHIGIGKISRKDGNLIWHINRNNVPVHTSNGYIEFYLQHAFDKSTDNARYTTYVLFSNGDENNYGLFGLKFKVNKKNDEIIFIKKQLPQLNVSSFTAGNYEIEKNGDCLLNYGGYTEWSTGRVVFMDYRNKHNKLYARYAFPGSVNAYQVHQLEDWRPPRPVITAQEDTLVAHGDMKEWTWFKLSGSDNTTIEKVGDGSVFKPKDAGLYCVSGKYGIGYAVSLPVYYKL